MDDESGYDGGSEATQTSVESEISLSDSERKKPCEICGSNANENKIITCCVCKVTREHIYCTRVIKHSVPPMWVCDKCFLALFPALRANQVVESIDQTSTSLTSTNQDVDHDEVVQRNMSTSDSSDKISATHQPSSHAQTSPVVEEASSPVPMDTSPVKKQKLPDSNLPSDTESAN